MTLEMQMPQTVLERRPDIPGPTARQYVDRDAAVVSPSYTRAYPFVMSHGRGCIVWDVDGNRFVDFAAGIAVCSTGHAHPDVVRAVQRQAEKFLHMSGTDFYYPAQIELAERLTEIVPGDFDKRVFFTNSGAEAVEAALKLARYATGRPRVLAFIGAFHGRTMGALSLTGSKAVHRRGFTPMLGGVTHVPYGYCYRCPLNLAYPGCDFACVEYIENTLFDRLVPSDEVAAIFVEPVQGEGGYVIPPDGWLQRLRQLCDRHDILLVADEVQSGIGRTGKWFAVEHWGVVPDIVCIAKGIASGLPLGAMVARQDLMVWPPGAHANTFGGNPVACVAALETIRLVEEGLMENAAYMGRYMLEQVRAMWPRHPSIGDVRGLGLMIGIEFVEDMVTRRPRKALRNAVVDRAFGKGLLLLGCGPNVIRFMPPLVIDRDTADEGLRIFEEVLTEVEAGGL